MPIPAPLATALAALNLAPPCHEHPPLATVEDAHAIWDSLPGAQVKNLFIKDAGKQYWLIVVPGDPRMDTKALAPLIGSKRISFASADDLRAILAVEPGSVTPLAMMNDTGKQFRLVIHSVLMQAETLLVHPLLNTATLAMPPRRPAALPRPPRRGTRPRGLATRLPQLNKNLLFLKKKKQKDFSSICTLPSRPVEAQVDRSFSLLS